MNKKVLFVEDDKEIALIYARVLQNSGYEVECVYDGESGLRRAQEQAYDIILLDLMLPNMSGIEVLRTLRNRDKTPNFNENTEVFILTNFSVDDLAKRELLSMAKDCLLKVEITPRLLVNILNGSATAASSMQPA